VLQGLMRPNRNRVWHRAAKVPRFELFSKVVGPMTISSVFRRSLAALGMAAFANACSVSNTGLGPTPDAGATSAAICPSGLTDQANWPAGTTYASCTKPCGPDQIGLTTCRQIDKSACLASSCVCLDSPCVACDSCALPPNSECYTPTNIASVPTCAKEVTRGGTCSPACGRQVCLEGDGKTGCVCNQQGKYACATWGETSWK